jgi:hypothetical protein
MDYPDFSHLKPATKAEAAAAAQSVAPVAETAIAAVLPAEPVPVVAFDGSLPRRAPVPLTWPVYVDGVRLEVVFVRRLSLAEVRAYVAAINAGGSPHLPMYEFPDGRPMPKAVLDQLDSDDFDAIDTRALDFLPLALRGDPTSD